MPARNRLRQLVPRRRPSLEELFVRTEGRLADKWTHYFDIYERHFLPLRDTAPRILEIGVSHGGSLDLWQQWFGSGCHIVGVDIAQRAEQLARPGIDIVIGDQSDPEFLQRLCADHGPFDIVIDDGSHQSSHQIASLEHLWASVVSGGVYLVEDLHANYWDEYEGGLRRAGTFVEYVKQLADDLHAFHSEQDDFEVSEWTRTLGGIHLYDSIVVLDRVDRAEPTRTMSGRPVFDTLYGQPVNNLLTDDHLAKINEMNRPHRRALRAMRSPIESSRRLVERLR